MSIDIVLWQEALKEFNEERFFECHEILEINWLKEKDLEQKNLLQGIIHMAAAFFHYHRNNLNGFQRQLEKGLKKLQRVRLDVYAKILQTDLTEFYKNILSSERPDSFPKIKFTGSEASQ